MADATLTDLLFRSATELAALVRDGEVTSRELVETSLERIEALDDRLNAFVHVEPEAALEAADAVDAGDARPFAGVPIAIKDIGPAWAGRPLTYGSDVFGDFTPDAHGNVVRRLLDAGFVPVGKTNVPEVGILNVTESRRHGPARNPWDPERTPGGSSGGSAAATAAGMVPIAHGNDGGGSIRIPAACCGLVGLKPARGRISVAPVLGDSFLATDGVLSRTVQDTARALDVLAGYELGDATWAPPPEAPFAAALDGEPSPRRVALVVNPPIDAPVDPVLAGAVREAGELLASLGHDVEEVELPWNVPELFAEFTKVWAVGIGATVDFGARISGREPGPETLEALTLELWRGAKGLDGIQHMRALVTMQAYGRMLVTAMAPFDAVVTPVMAQRQVRIGEIDPEAGMEAFYKAGQFTPFTAVVNISGQPAISLPLLHDDGLPVPVQVIGRPAGERDLLALAAQVERARPWADRRPGVL
ncbi:MAG TPA: amidase [Solirubrobacteraceae bacterium]|nr:amidase [Solirubrobacteraceae bacterium]